MGQNHLFVKTASQKPQQGGSSGRQSNKESKTFNQTFSKTESALCFGGIVAINKAYFENESSASQAVIS